MVAQNCDAMNNTPLTAAALAATQGMFRAASAANGFTNHARTLELKNAALRHALTEIRDGFRQDGRVWLTVPGHPDRRERGPALADFINGVLKQFSQ